MSNGGGRMSGERVEPGEALVTVIVNYNSGKLVCDCLDSIRRVCVVPPAVIVVDNASPDGSADVIESHVRTAGLAGFVSVVRAERNGGFGAGNNVGISLAMRRGARLIWLLNPDTVLTMCPLKVFTAFFEANPRAGAAGTAMRDEAGIRQRAAHFGPSLGAEFRRAARMAPASPDCQGTDPVACDWVSGASFVVRREVFEQIGGFDEGFFLYFEEVDLCLRMLRQGWTVWHLPTIDVVHLEGASTGIQAAARRRPRYWFESRRRCLARHRGKLTVPAFDLAWLGGRALRVLKTLAGRTPVADPPRFWADMIGGDLLWMVRGTRTSTREANAMNPLPPKHVA